MANDLQKKPLSRNHQIRNKASVYQFCSRTYENNAFVMFPGMDQGTFWMLGFLLLGVGSLGKCSVADNEISQVNYTYNEIH